MRKGLESRLVPTWLQVLVLSLLPSVLHGAAASSQAAFETPFVRVAVSPVNGGYEIRDKATGVIWRSSPYHARFGEITYRIDGREQRADLAACEVTRDGDGLELVFHPSRADRELWFRARLRAEADQRAIRFSYDADERLGVESVRLLDDSLWVTDADRGYVVVPVREGLLIPAGSGLEFTHRFDTFAYEGCHMEMLGVVKDGAAALLTWHDPYVAADVRSVLTNAVWAGGRQVVSPTLTLRKSARSFQLHLLGKGDYVTIGKAYREVAAQKSWLVTWDEKLKGHPERARLFGAVNFKLWSALDRRMSADSSKEERVTVNWTFDEAAQVAEHLKIDLQLDKVLFLMGGWIHRGYDNQHPDILPTAPECGGDEAFAACAQRVRQQGYLFGLHDNYQDIYRDSPSWSESYVQKNRDGGLSGGGHWAGGVAYLTCAQKALELAARPQNLPAVLRLSRADAYFIDTTYAAGLQECFDPNHPLTRWDDMRWKQALSDYSRRLFGIFGSECGREWAIPHSDFFEGLTGVSGRYYHDANLVGKVGGVVVPLFEVVYRDCIAMYGKYGYDLSQSSEYVLHHLAIGRPLHYHSVPPHLYWKEPSRASEPLAVRPGLAQLSSVGPRQLEITYAWNVEQTPPSDWRVFVHFVDMSGNIKFQDDYEPAVAVSKWAPGQRTDGPRRVLVPDGVGGSLEIRMGLFQPSRGSRRAVLMGSDEDGERSYTVGRLSVSGSSLTCEIVPPAASKGTGDRALYTRGAQGWSDGMNRLDRFVKNTAEILSPLNELTARTTVTDHQFLTGNYKVQRTVFGEGTNRTEVIVNANSGNYAYAAGGNLGTLLLPPYGFLVQSPTFVAFCALETGEGKFSGPTLFTVRSLDGKPLGPGVRARVFHGFGDPQFTWSGKTFAVTREAEFVLP